VAVEDAVDGAWQLSEADEEHEGKHPVAGIPVEVVIPKGVPGQTASFGPRRVRNGSVISCRQP
jgi:hypothetical protein